MKIYILPMHSKFMPLKQPFKYPQHNDDYGIEQDFFIFLKNNDLITDSPLVADWHYLPIYWTRWHLNHNYGKDGKEELELGVKKIILDDKKTFTICQYDRGPLIDLGQVTLFTPSRLDNMSCLKNQNLTPNLKKEVSVSDFLKEREYFSVIITS